MRRLLLMILFLPLAAHAQVSSQLFDAGVNKNSTVQCYSDGNNVAAQLYGIRLWDDGLKWNQIQATNTAPTFTTFDSFVLTRALGVNARAGINVAVGANCPGTSGMKIIYTFGATPEWASACFGLGDPSPCLPGPVGTTLISSTCSIASGTATLTCPGASPGFSSFTGPEGPALTITGAGPAGATLTTYITGFTSATQVTVAVNASTSVVSTGTVTLSGFGGGAQCSSPPGTGDYGCTPTSDVAIDGSGTDLAWMTLVSDIITRYAGKITYYEWWNEFDSSNFWCSQGSPAGCGGGNPQTTSNVPSNNRLVRMAWDAYQIMKCLDPAAKALSPSFHVGTALTTFHFWNTDSVAVPALTAGVDGFPLGCSTIGAQTVTGSQTYDYVNVHARGTNAANPNAAGNWNPAAMITAVTNTKTEIANDSLPNPTIIFNDEYGYNSALEGGNNSTGYSAYVAQTLTFCASLGLTQCYWYQWDTTSIGLQGVAQGTAWDTWANQLTGATVTVPCALVGALYECAFTKGGIPELIVWDTSKYATTCCLAPANQTFSALYTYYVDVTGAQRTTTAGVAPVGWSPILLQQISTTVVPPVIINGAVTIDGNSVIR